MNQHPSSQIGLWHIRLTAAFVALGAASIVIFWKQLPPQLPLFYSRAWGTDQLVSPAWLFMLPGLCLLIGIAASYCPRFIRDKVLLITCLASLITVQSIMALALIRIIVLVV